MFKQSNRPDLVERSIQNHLESGQVTKNDISIIKQYVHEKVANQQLSPSRQQKIIYTLIGWRRFLPNEYSTVTIGDVHTALCELPESESFKGHKPSQNTQHDWIRILKPFLLWLNENEIIAIPEKKIRLIKSPGVDRDTKGSDDILSYEEVIKIIEGATSLRDKAFISVIYESGCRVGEVCELKWKDLIFDEYGVKVNIADKKTNKRRYSRLTFSTNYLSSWRNDYRGYGEPVGDKSVFINIRGEPMEYSTIRKLLTRAVHNAKVTKRVHPHLFRDSRITHMVAQGYQESVIKESMWGNVSTEMFRTYVKLSEQNIDDEFLLKAGIEVKKEEKEEPIKPRMCGNCHHHNAPTDRFCSICGSPLTEEIARDLNSLKNEIKSTEDYKKLYDELFSKVSSLESLINNQ